ncbi:hypothetical protein ACIOJD_09870 [Streptomyces sp. NPDC088116]|uniref:hypothetical protein n=1 Tax=Streptomyces sp. NPDC088116 TaxID=3365825 RepID=UPI0038296449
MRTAPGRTGRTRGPSDRATTGAAVAGPAGIASSATAPAGSAGSSGRATGRAGEGTPRSGDGLPDVTRTSRTRPPGAPSSTACDSVPAKEGFCQVVSAPPKPGSATPRGGRAAAVGRIGGRLDQPAAPRPVTV